MKPKKQRLKLTQQIETMAALINVGCKWVHHGGKKVFIAGKQFQHQHLPLAIARAEHLRKGGV